MTPDELARLLQSRPLGGERVELKVSAGRSPRGECGWCGRRSAKHCGEESVYRIHWDTGDRSSFCGPHAADVRRAYQSRIVRIEEVR
jgi:hypothetical protein